MYNIENLEEPYPEELIEIGVNLVSRHCDLYDIGDGRFEYLPTKDFLIFIKCKKSEYTSEFIKQEVRKRGYGRAFVIRSYWVCEPGPHPF